MVMNDQEFAKKSDAALRVTRAVMAAFGIENLGADEVEVFNVVLKALVVADKEEKQWGDYGTAAGERFGANS